MSQDIRDTMSRVIGDSPGRWSVDVEGQARHHRPAHRTTPVAEVARRYGVHRSWIYRLKARYDTDGDAAFQPRSRRPRQHPDRHPGGAVELILQLRTELTAAAWTPARTPSAGTSNTATTSRCHGRRSTGSWSAPAPSPPSRPSDPRSSYIRFEAEQPNETWQSDFTHYRLTRPDGRPGADVEIITWLDDHSRYALHVTAHPRITGPDRARHLRRNRCHHGDPASTLTDNGMVYTVRFAGGRGGRTQLETELRRRGITQKNSRPTTPPPAAKSNGSSRP